MRILFLDFDGVLNHRAFVDASASPHTPGPHLLDARAVSLVEAFCVEARAGIVVTSSWRGAYDAVSLEGMLRDKGLATTPFLGVTPLIPYKRGRGQEVQAWLDAAPRALGITVTSFVVLDDVDDLLHLTPHLVLTSYDHGLTPVHLAAARAILAPMSEKNLGSFVWYDLMTTDADAAKAFYGDVVGWTTEPFGGEGSGYAVWVAGQGAIGGVSNLRDEAKARGAGPSWMGHVEVDDADRAAARAEELGGTIVAPPTDIPTVGRFAVVADPSGAHLSVVSFLHSSRRRDLSKPGEISWHELYSSNPDAALAFYGALFGWKKEGEVDMGPMGAYVLLGNGGPNALGGLMRLPPGVPVSVWGYYVVTTELDAALERAKARGARVMRGPMEVPGGQRVVQLLDPQGAGFALTTPRTG